MTTPTDIVVRRCRVRVVRRGGWSWGPQPRHLVDQVIAALPDLIAGQLGDLVPDGAPDMEITEPVRIAASLRLPDLRAGRLDPLQQAAMAVEPYPEPVLASGFSPTRVSTRPDEPPPVGRTPAIPAYAQPTTLAQFLAGLFDRGGLDHFLALLPVGTLEVWYEALAALPAAASATRDEGTAPPGVAPGCLPGGSSHMATDVPAMQSRVTASPETSRAQQLQAAIAARLARAGRPASGQPYDPAASLRGRADPADPALGGSRPPRNGAAPEAASANAARVPAATSASAVSVPGTAANAVSVPRARAADAVPVPEVGTVEVSSALPFLLLGPLEQTGYLAALAPALQAVGAERQTAAFATALAYTVLGPLERGWRRQPEDLAAAAAFAGLGTPVPGPALAEFARVASPALPALDAVVTLALAEGHAPGEPLVLVGAEDRAGGGLLLSDREGLFPVAWADTLDSLLPAWRMCGSPSVLVASAAAGALRGLAATSASFVVAAPPGRGEHWRRLPPHRLWTNNRDDPAIARYASGYQRAVELAAELAQALVGDRTAVPLAASPALGRSLLLAAGLALGTLAWTLWREREPTDPLLALERFANLSARVSFEPDRVRVRVPLGPRHTDLSEHGLLADVRGVPWLGDRVVEFSGG